MQKAKIYQAVNGSFGASCDGIQSTGHHIVKDVQGKFTVYSVHDEDRKICEGVSRSRAEELIAEDWRADA